MYLIQTICRRGLKGFLQHQQTQLVGTLWSHSMPCLLHFSVLVSPAEALLLLCPFDCQIKCWWITFKSGQCHAFMRNQLGVMNQTMWWFLEMWKFSADVTELVSLLKRPVCDIYGCCGRTSLQCSLTVWAWEFLVSVALSLLWTVS